ncbi:hypothetical protein CAEBREN_15092 [Caenorhabditis brenneri]|uniref:G-protein coupled receptors family 1 profile domain-containing protein n=1 Tax=Caenorhabditis brenneri TaxID=135651 RepID=G0M9R7_CAEBE|nr:hypothetical protein CAEBREN_15092 [Caenorhabditis brenneri]
MKPDDRFYKYFANLTEPVKTISLFIYDITYKSAEKSYSITAYLCMFGLFVNFFHIFILSRKSMRQSSVNVLMIGQSISDIICFFYETGSLPLVKNFLTTGNNECDPPVSYLRVLATYSYLYLDAICRRVSPWIGVVMAAFRLLITSFPFNNTIAKLGNPISSLCSILILFVISTLRLSSEFQSSKIWISDCV